MPSKTVQTKYITNYPSVALPVNDLQNNFELDLNGYIGRSWVSYNNISYNEIYERDSNGKITRISQWTPDTIFDGDFLLLDNTNFLLLLDENFSFLSA